MSVLREPLSRDLEHALPQVQIAPPQPRASVEPQPREGQVRQAPVTPLALRWKNEPKQNETGWVGSGVGKGWDVMGWEGRGVVAYTFLLFKKEEKEEEEGE